MSFLALTAGCNYHFPKNKIRTGPGKTFALKGHDVWSWHIVLVGGVGIYNPCTVCSQFFLSTYLALKYGKSGPEKLYTPMNE